MILHQLLPNEGFLSFQHSLLKARDTLASSKRNIMIILW
jgi:hypothetical protein